MEFLYLFLYRALSGAQNGLGYARRHLALLLLTWIMIGMAGALAYYAAAVQADAWYWRAGAGLCALAGASGAWMLYLSFFRQGRGYDIHFWELVTTGAITIGTALAGGNLVLIIASVYPALILHKGFVNLGGGLGWWDSRTDDATGRTFRIPLLGISIPRASTRVRLILAGLSLALALAAWLIPISITVQRIVG